MNEVIPVNKQNQETNGIKFNLRYILILFLVALYTTTIASTSVRFLKSKANSQDLIFSFVSTTYVITVLVIGIVLLALLIPFVYAIALSFLSKLAGPERKITISESWLWVLITQVIAANIILILLNFNVSAHTYFMVEGILASISLSIGYGLILKKLAKSKQLPTLILFICVAVVNITLTLLIPYL